jgi:hypothetical protein
MLQPVMREAGGRRLRSWDRVEAERGPTVRAEEDPDAGACDSSNYLDLMILKGRVAVLR